MFASAARHPTWPSFVPCQTNNWNGCKHTSIQRLRHFPSTAQPTHKVLSGRTAKVLGVSPPRAPCLRYLTSAMRDAGAGDLDIEPVSAAVLASLEHERRDKVRRKGNCGVGCREVDDEVLMGGLERGVVVGISSETSSQDFGLRVGFPFSPAEAKRCAGSTGSGVG